MVGTHPRFMIYSIVVVICNDLVNFVIAIQGIASVTTKQHGRRAKKDASTFQHSVANRYVDDTLLCKYIDHCKISEDNNGFIGRVEYIYDDMDNTMEDDEVEGVQESIQNSSLLV